jgi:spore coat protein H
MRIPRRKKTTSKFRKSPKWIELFKTEITIKNSVLAIVILLVLAICPGCNKDNAVLQPVGKSLAVEKEVMPDINNVSLQDSDHVYMYDDDDSIVTMYLTVRQGNKEENTNHTWKSLNDYSVYDYVKLGIDRYKVEAILQVGDENGPISGELGYGLKIPNAIVQIRGASTSMEPQKSFKITLKDNAGEWEQQRTIALNKHYYDGLRFRNKLCYDLIKQIPSLISLRTQFVHLYVKDETVDKPNLKFVDYGLFTQVEQLNKKFLENHSLDPGGQLYKLNYFEYYRYEDTIKLKSDPTYDVAKFEQLMEIKGNDDHSKLIAMLDDLNDYSKPIEEVFEKNFDAENYFTWLAFNLLVGNIDSQSRNYYLYSPLNSSKWYFIAWDCDVTFWRHEDTILLGDQDIGYESGISNYWGDVLHNRVLRIPKYRAMLDAKVQSMRKFLSAEKINSMADSYQAATEKFVYAMPDIMHARLTPKQYDDVKKNLAAEVDKNYQLYLESLKKPMPFYLDVPKLENGKMVFSWNTSYDMNGQDITYSFELAKDYLFKDVIYRENGLRFPSVTNKTLAPGQYFFRVYATNEDGQRQSAMAYYVADSKKYYATQCFYILKDGEVVQDNAK